MKTTLIITILAAAILLAGHIEWADHARICAENVRACS